MKRNLDVESKIVVTVKKMYQQHLFHRNSWKTSRIFMSLTDDGIKFICEKILGTTLVENICRKDNSIEIEIRNAFAWIDCIDRVTLFEENIILNDIFYVKDVKDRYRRYLISLGIIKNHSHKTFKRKIKGE